MSALHIVSHPFVSPVAKTLQFSTYFAPANNQLRPASTNTITSTQRQTLAGSLHCPVRFAATTPNSFSTGNKYLIFPG
jgi:hypothetical protein